MKTRGKKIKVPPELARLSEGPPEPVERELSHLTSVGPATIEDLHLLGIETVAQLAECDARALYAELCEVTGARHDPCCEDVFAAAIAQALDPDLPQEQRQWWYWTRLRKEREAASQRRAARG
jgi:hypothetical protein